MYAFTVISGILEEQTYTKTTTNSARSLNYIPEQHLGDTVTITQVDEGISGFLIKSRKYLNFFPFSLRHSAGENKDVISSPGEIS